MTSAHLSMTDDNIDAQKVELFYKSEVCFHSNI